MTFDASVLARFGWNAHMQSRIDREALRRGELVRVISVHRDALDVAGPAFEGRVTPFHGDPDDEEDAATVGDWLVVDTSARRPLERLGRFSLFSRRAAGTAARVQLIAANVDTLFVVTSCNRDFNPARLERYLALAHTAGVVPVVVLTKGDLADDAADYAGRARALAQGLLVETVDARDARSSACLDVWCGPGQTVAMAGSSGVGKSTLMNTLAGADIQATAAIREDDSRGRHTTSARSLHRLPAGGWLLDTPGMRELQVAGMREGIEEVFAAIVAAEAMCRFSDCRHEGEPGCAVEAAVEEGRIDAGQVARYLKLAAEDERNTETIAARRARERSFGKLIREVSRERKRRGRE